MKVSCYCLGVSFVGRRQEFAVLDRELERVRASGDGRLVVVRGRRQVGKSTLLTAWLEERGVPSAFFTASRRPPRREVELFTREIAESSLPGAASFAAAHPGDWDDALSLLASAHDPAVPVVVVLDEFPYMVGVDASVEATLQKQWDRRLSHLPLLLVLVGSDLGMMASLGAYDRPLYGRTSRELVVDPLTPADVAELLDLEPAAAIDAYLVAGGFPGVVTSWPPGVDVRAFLESAMADPTSPLVVAGERSLAAEFPPQAHPRLVLEVIGTGQRTFRAIADRAGISDASLQRALDVLVTKHVVAVEEPLSTRPASKQRRYRVADPYLRFWLRFIGPQLANLERGRSELVIRRLWASWESYRGVAVEPLVRTAVERLLPDSRFGEALLVGGWWSRAHTEEVDLVGVSGGPRPPRVEFVGSVKWRSQGRFGRDDERRLAQHAAMVPGVDADTVHVGVSRAGFAEQSLDVRLGPQDLVTAWVPRP